MTPCLATHSDDNLRRLMESNDGALGGPAKLELVRRGLISTPESIAKIKADRQKYRRHASNAEGDWGFTARGRRFSR